MSINDIKHYNFSSYLHKFKLKITGLTTTDIFCPLNITVHFFTWLKSIDVFNCRFLSTARYPWIKRVCSDTFWKVDASLLLVWISILRDASAGITFNSGPPAVVTLAGLQCATGSVHFTDTSLWTLVLKQKGTKIKITTNTSVDSEWLTIVSDNRCLGIFMHTLHWKKSLCKLTSSAR